MTLLQELAVYLAAQVAPTTYVDINGVTQPLAGFTLSTNLFIHDFPVNSTEKHYMVMKLVEENGDVSVGDPRRFATLTFAIVAQDWLQADAREATIHAVFHDNSLVTFENHKMLISNRGNPQRLGDDNMHRKILKLDFQIQYVTLT